LAIPFRERLAIPFRERLAIPFRERFAIGTQLHHSFTYGALSMAAYAFS
jgi:hypothetical protein